MNAFILMMLTLAASCSRHHAGRTFIIYNQIHYKNTPADLTGYGISSSVIHYPRTFLDSIPGDPSNTGNANLDCKVIDSAKLVALAATDAQTGSRIPVILDIEAWSYTPANIAATVDSFQKVIALYREFNTRSPIGFYGGVPENRWAWNNISTPAQFQTWQLANDQLAPIVPRFQFFGPDLYNYGNSIDSVTWRQYAQANLNEIRRYNSGKPVYAFFCPQYGKGQFVPYATWQYELSTVYDMGYDGVIIWSSNLDSASHVIDFPTATQKGWWQATEDFIASKKIIAQ